MPRSKDSKRTKYIFVSGGVISGIGKGLTAASIALLLKSAGYRVAPIKFEGYLNIDAGTINPIEHGDPFLCEDGTETDMDIGTYEKFLSEDMGRMNFGTMGQVYQTIIAKERRFEYKGEDVEAIHISEEIIGRIKNLGKEKNADVVIIELGGTVGEYWNVFYYESARMMTLQNPGDVVHIHVSYVPTPGHLGEPKTKPTQLSVRTLNSLGIQPDFIVARSEKYLDKRRRDRFALFCNVHPDDIISNPDLSSVYGIPQVLLEQNLPQRIMQKLGLTVRTPKIRQWDELNAKIVGKKKKTVTVAIIGKYFGTGEYQLRDSYAALFDAINHAAWEVGVDVETKWIDAEQVEKDGAKKIIGNPSGIIVPIGWGERGAEGMIAAASYARKEKIPYLGLCYGMQLAVVAFARDMMGWKDANTEENDIKTSHKVIHFIEEQRELLKANKYGATMRLGGWEAAVEKNTQAYKLYEKYGGLLNRDGLSSERHRHRYEFNDVFGPDLEEKGLIIAARSVKERLVEIIELSQKDHPFYMGTQGHPEYKSRPLQPHAFFVGFLQAAAK